MGLWAVDERRYAGTLVNLRTVKGEDADQEATGAGGEVGTCHRFFGNDRAERRAKRRGTSRMLSRASGESVGKALPTAVT